MSDNAIKRSSEILSKTTVIIPVYNEINTIVDMVNVLLSRFDPDKIIIVDDHSTDGTKDELKKVEKKLLVLSNTLQQGKTNSIRTALQYVTTKYSLLLDGDLENFDENDIDQLINKFARIDDNSMLISYREGGSFHEHKVILVDPVLNGERMLLTSTLKKLLEGVDYKGYELEMLLNKYFLDNNLPIEIVPLDIYQKVKKNKRGFLKGLYQDLQMGLTLIIVFGLFEVLRQRIMISLKFQLERKPKTKAQSGTTEPF